MWRLLFFLVFLILSVFLGMLAVKHPGYVLFVYQTTLSPSTIIQIPFWFAFLAIFTLLVIFYWVLSSIDQLERASEHIKNWWRTRCEHRSYLNMQKGLSFLILGEYKKAEKYLIGSIQTNTFALINYLGAAKAAVKLQKNEEANNYLLKAKKLYPNATNTIQIVKARLCMMNKEFSEAREILETLQQKTPKQKSVVSLLEKIYVHEGDFEKLSLLLPSLYKTGMINKTEWALFEKNIYHELIKNSSPQTWLEAEKKWSQLPRHIRKYPAVIAAYVQKIVAFQDALPTIEKLIKQTLKTEYEEELVCIFANLPLSNLNRQLVIATAWLKAYGDKPALLYLLGTLCTQLKLWGKAKEYFKKALAHPENASPDLRAKTGLAYGKLLTSLGETEAALTVYQTVLEEDAKSR